MGRTTKTLDELLDSVFRAQETLKNSNPGDRAYRLAMTTLSKDIKRLRRIDSDYALDAAISVIEIIKPGKRPKEKPVEAPSKYRLRNVRAAKARQDKRLQELEAFSRREAEAANMSPKEAHVVIPQAKRETLGLLPKNKNLVSTVDRLLKAAGILAAQSPLEARDAAAFAAREAAQGSRHQKQAVELVKKIENVHRNLPPLIKR